MPAYIPIIRPGNIEWRAVKRFSGGIKRFQDEDTWDDDLLPMIEPVAPGQESQFEKYQEVARGLMVDFPRFLSDRSTKFNDLPDFLTQFDDDPAKFFQENQKEIDIPVLSEAQTELLHYEDISQLVDDGRPNFSDVAVRLFIRNATLTSAQDNAIQQIMDKLTEGDLVLLDTVDIGGFEGRFYENLRTIKEYTPEDVSTLIINAFQPREGQEAHNYGPVVAKDLDLDGFGDYMLEPRYPSGGGGGGDPDRIIRHYSEQDFEVQNFRADTYAQAFSALSNSAYFDSSHCTFCGQMGDKTQRNEWHGFWKKNRIGHYINSVLEQTVEMMEEYSAEDLDMDGYETIRKRRTPR